ncbi:MAG: tetratricopeptide repeat protein [Proteobacteria bacterium]|nr:tetratricopeptide repeat protein [Pseudomonadota bacterium]
MYVAIERWLIVIALMYPSVLAAQGTQEQESQARAKELYLEGKAHFQEGRYDEAKAAFTESYNLSGESALLYNLGITAEQLGDKERAIAYYEIYLEELPDATDAEDVKKRLERLRAGPIDESQPAVVPLDENEAPPIAQSSNESRHGYYDMDEEDDDGQREIFWPGLPLGIGALFLAGGTVTAISAYTKYNGLEDGCSPDCASGDIRSAKNLALTTDILYACGGVAVVTGVILWIVRSRGNKEKVMSQAWHAVPAGLPGGGGLIVEGRF